MLNTTITAILGGPEMIILGIAILLLFGGKKIPELMKGLGKGIKEFKNGSKKVDPNLMQVTIKFSAKMDKRYRNFELGPLGETNLLKIKAFTGFSDDGYSASFSVALKPNKQYQLVLGSGFRNENGIPLKPYLIEFTTAE